MGRAIGTVWAGIRDVYDDLFPFIGMNLIWLLPTLALASIFAFVLSPIILGVGSFGREAASGDVTTAVYTFVSAFVGVLMVFTPNPAAAGIHYYANRKVNDQLVDFSLFWEGLRKYWKKALWLCLISVGGFGLLIVNIIFYISRGDQALGVIAMIFVWLLLIWLMMQMYALPLLMEQESKSIRLVLRNAAVLTFSNPGFSIVLFILVVLISAFSVGVVFLVLLLGCPLIALIEQHAVVTLLEKYRSSKVS